MILKEAVVLLVDDDAADRELTRRALVKEGVKTQLQEVCDGEEALSYLHQRDAFSDPGRAPRPDLILLDLNMPKMNGREFLKAVSGTEFASIPVVMLTTSDHDVDVQACYDYGCSSYISKPVGIEDFARAIADLGRYWFQLVTLPAKT